ncbi:replication associated protein [Peromfec virus RodF7_22]|uniref:Replication-associated protein n=1 Tax=Peromfec virus RodF7_22 TaxID=2929270 RepID=A0A976R5I9_9VIRU|nr:replication associated protein [Peromfec virus RodF7_22]
MQDPQDFPSDFGEDAQNIVQPKQLNYRGRRFNITVNDLKGIEEDDWKNYVNHFYMLRQNEIKYMIWCLEKAPTTGHAHLHGYVEWNIRQYASVFKRWFNNPHVEPAKGSRKNNEDYMMKDGDYKEWGGRKSPEELIEKEEKRKEKYRTLIEDIVNMDDEELEREHPDIVFHNWNKVQEIRSRKIKAKDQWGGYLNKKNVWIWGTPGTGKSKWARSICPPEHVYPKNANKWWNGYNEREHWIVLIDDFPKENKLAYYMKCWCDRYPTTGEVKNAHVALNPGTYNLIVTSNYSIDDCFDSIDAEAIRRRFQEVHIDDIQWIGELEKPRLVHKDGQEWQDAQKANEEEEGTLQERLERLLDSESND